MTVMFVFGTTAELIKLFPVIELVGKAESVLVCTKQQGDSLQSALHSYGLGDDVQLMNFRFGQLSRRRQVPSWSLRAAIHVRRCLQLMNRSALTGSRALVVHGDTLTALIGAVVGKLCRIQVLHIEAGLRSGSVFHPFPEELIRRVIGRLGDVHYAPTIEAISNLQGVQGDVVYTHGNTSLDSLRSQIKGGQPNSQCQDKFCLVTLHRSELLNSRITMKQTIEELLEISHSINVVMVVDERSSETFMTLFREFPRLNRFDLRSKMEHDLFIQTVLNSEFIITDSGGLQEEAAVLGVPCIVHRKKTERLDGIGKNIVLSNWREGALVRFARNYASLRSTTVLQADSPSEKIVADLVNRGLIVGN